MEDEPWEKYVKTIKPVIKALIVQVLSYGMPEIGKSTETETIDEWLPKALEEGLGNGEYWVMGIKLF